MLDRGRIRKYLLYAIGEICLVVIGILIALQINNWNNGRLDEQAEIQAYKNLKRQLSEDLTELKKVIEYNESNSKSIRFALGVIERKEYQKADSLVVGSHGRNGLSEFFLGSVSNYVCHHVTCAVLLVHQSEPSETHQPEAEVEVSVNQSI